MKSDICSMVRLLARIWNYYYSMINTKIKWSLTCASITCFVHLTISSFSYLSYHLKYLKIEGKFVSKRRPTVGHELVK